MRGGAGSPTAVEVSRSRQSPTVMNPQTHKQAHWDESELQQPPLQPTKPAPAPPLAAIPSQGGSRTIVVNKKGYSRLDMLGKGGSSRVFRVMTHTHEIFALKRVALDKVDAETMNGYMNEIALLKRLEGNQRIIRLYDSEVKQGSGGSKGALLLVMECGEIDLAKLLQEQQKEPMDPVWVAYYWKQVSPAPPYGTSAYMGQGLNPRPNRCCRRCTSSTKRRSCTRTSSPRTLCSLRVS